MRKTIEIQQEITAGEPLAIKIKQFYYADETWTPKLAFIIGYKMRDIKRAAKKFYKDKDIIEILNELRHYNKEDLEELLKL